MPTYQYKCLACGHQFEKTMLLSEHEHPPAIACPKCHSTNVRQVPASFQAITGTKT
jgi:putative FmdB family regulatory protein